MESKGGLSVVRLAAYTLISITGLGSEIRLYGVSRPLEVIQVKLVYVSK